MLNKALTTAICTVSFSNVLFDEFSFNSVTNNTDSYVNVIGFIKVITLVIFNKNFQFIWMENR